MKKYTLVFLLTFCLAQTAWAGVSYQDRNQTFFSIDAARVWLQSQSGQNLPARSCNCPPPAYPACPSGYSKAGTILFNNAVQTKHDDTTLSQGRILIVRSRTCLEGQPCKIWHACVVCKGSYSLKSREPPPNPLPMGPTRN